MPWIWSCHKCHTRYALGATRRCLHDGHYFCGGTTVDKNTGKTRRHRACGSEFDYMGWEDFGHWKREYRHLDNSQPKHCENQCDFPSACHWKAKHAPKQEANFDFLDSKCLSTELKPTSPVEATTLSSVPKLASHYIDRLVKATEKHTSQITTLLSTMEEESSFASTPGYIPPSNPPVLNPLKLSFPVMDFSSLQKDPTSPSRTLHPEPHLVIPLPAPDTDEDTPDVDMTDWIAKDTIDSPPTSPKKSHSPTVEGIPFESYLSSSLPAITDNESPISPVRSVWEWTRGEIGIALSSPVRQAHGQEGWDEGMGTGVQGEGGKEEGEEQWEEEEEEEEEGTGLGMGVL